jgi:peptide/nickel transport system substrate-binding protein
VRRTLGALSAGVLAFAVAAAGCSQTTEGEGESTEQQQQTGTIATDPADSQGPAKAVDGATKGGVVKILHLAEFEHLDPQRTYVSDALSMSTQFARTLTGYREDGQGNLKLVGDLATTAGEDVNKDCKVWKYTLKDGLKFQDGTPITAQDVAYGISRSFDTETISDGPAYVQSWLTGNSDFASVYNGPYKSPGKPVPGLTVNGDKEITFTFPKPQCETPYALAMPTSSPVPQAKDTKGDYDRMPFSSGPYMIKEHKYDQFIEFVRNPNWDPATDPIRNAYPDGIRVEFGIDQETASNRLIADAPDDKSAMMWQNVPAALLPNTEAAGVKERTKPGESQYVEYIYINTERVKDLKVRQAVNWAINRDAIVKIRGGVDTITGATIISPTIAGYKQFNAYDGGPTGNPEKAKELLAGQSVKLTFAYPQTPQREQIAASVQESLGRAGIEVVLNPLDPATFYATVGTRGNKFDLIRGGWGADWPSASTVIPALFDGRALRPTGNQNLAYLNDPMVNSEIDRIQTLPADEAADEWAKLDERMMKEIAPIIPMYYIGNYEMHGSKIGGTFLSDSYGHLTLNTVYVKP